MMRNVLFALSLIAVLAAGCATVPPQAPPAPPAEPVALTFLLTADLQGLIEPQATGGEEGGSTGGMARIAAVGNAVRQQAAGPVIMASTGDDLMGKYFHAFNGKPVFDVMAKAGYSVFAFGNHEFDKGPDILAEALETAAFPIVASDLATAGTPLDGKTQETLIQTAGGVRIGYFSLMTEDFPLVTSGGAVKLAQRNHDAARQRVAELRAANVDLVVALTHIGDAADEALARAVPGIDVILGGHSHLYLPDLVRAGDTLIINGGEKGSHVARLDLPVTPGVGPDPAAARYQLIPVDAAVPEEPGIAALVAAYQEQLPDAIVLGQTAKPWDLTSHALRFGESPVACLITDALRSKFQVDLVLINAGSFRGKRVYPAGPVTDEMLSEIDEFRNYMFRFTIKGEHLPLILERSAACHGEGCLLQVSGLRYAFDPSRPAQELTVDGDGAATGVKTAGQRLLSAEVAAGGGWEPIDPEAEYTVLTSAFLFERAGDGYYWFRQHGTGGENTMSTLYSILAELAGNQDSLDPPEPDGRITVVAGS